MNGKGAETSEATSVYLKAGEYGETELNNHWSVFREPLNSWSSLFFSFFGTEVQYYCRTNC